MVAGGDGRSAIVAALVRASTPAPADGDVIHLPDWNMPGVLVLTDTYFPGWKAKVDGREVPATV